MRQPWYFTNHSDLYAVFSYICNCVALDTGMCDEETIIEDVANNRSWNCILFYNNTPTELGYI